MTLEAYIHEVLSSEVEDWTVFSFVEVNTGLTRKGFDPAHFNEGFDNLPYYTNAASLKKDLSIGLAWGLEINDDFREVWANKFPDPKATSSSIDFFYNNTLVLQEVYATVDGGRCHLPLPDRHTNSDSLQDWPLTIAQPKSDLFRLINALASSYEFDNYLKRAGIKIVKESWPQ